VTEASGAGAVAAVLERLGVSHVFGMPGTQNIDLFEAIRSRSGVRAVLCAHELGAAFMANGYFRACGKPAVVLTVPGAGLAYALAGLAEAKRDSAALLHIVCTGEEQTAGRPRAESLDEAAMAATVVKESFDLVDAETIGEVIAKAHRACMAGEPGPVMLRIADEVLRAERPAAGVDASAPARALPDAGAGAEVTSLLAAARRPLLFVGQGAVAAAEGVQRLAEQHGAALLTTTSGRGIVPEDHRLALAFDFLHHDIAELNRLVAACDLVIALGCKLSSNGTGGYALELPRDRLITINSATGVNQDRYPARIALQARAEDWVDLALDAVPTRVWLALGWYGAGTLALGSWAWYSGLARAEASVAAGFMGLMPVSALVLSYVLLDQPFRWVHLLGFATVFGGVVLISREHAHPGG